jgi:hypothetical protein
VRRLQLGGMLIGVMFSGFFGVPDGVHGMTVSYVRMVSCLDVVAVLVVASRFPMMPGRMLVVFGCLDMVVNAFMLRHVFHSSFRCDFRLPVA